MSKWKYAIAAGVLAAAFYAVPGAAEDKKPPAAGKIEKVMVHGKSLEGNLQGDPAERDVAIYLPPSYSKGNKRYPVVYLLHGYGRTADDWYPFVGFPGAMDRNIAAGAKEMIIVMPDGNSLYGGSMWSNSPTIGDWETYVTKDLVGYVDSHYRTLANRASRGLGGHSMGGYGTWRLAMKYPDVYSAIYGLSACCLMNNPRPPGPPRAGNQAKGDGKGKGKAGDDAVRPGARGGHPVDVGKGEAAAWSPNPQNPPLFFDEPVKNGEFQPSVAARWVANSPLAMLDQYVSNMKKYSAIAMDIGLQDTLIDSNRELDQAMTRLGIQHTFETYEGNHNNHLADRIEGNVLPFFSKHLNP